MNWSERATRIRAIVLDIDGVLTDGTIGYRPPEGIVKFFDVKDGAAIRMALREGLRVGLLSGRADPVNLGRAEDLEMSFVYMGEANKRVGFERLLAEQKLEAEQCLCIGDDLSDIPLLRRAGIGVAVADAVEECREHADYVTQSRGGRGAVREVITLLMKAQGLWERALGRYLDD